MGKSMEDSPDYGTSLIGATVTIRGRLHTRKENLTIMGTIDGVIDHDQYLQIHGQGRVNAEVCAREVQVDGVLRGAIYALEKVRIGASGNVEGNIYSKLFSVEEGATLKGNVIMESVGDAVMQRFQTKHPAIESLKEPTKPKSPPARATRVVGNSIVERDTSATKEADR